MCTFNINCTYEYARICLPHYSCAPQRLKISAITKFPTIKITQRPKKAKKIITGRQFHLLNPVSKFVSIAPSSRAGSTAANKLFNQQRLCNNIPFEIHIHTLVHGRKYLLRPRALHMIYSRWPASDSPPSNWINRRNHYLSMHVFIYSRRCTRAIFGIGREKSRTRGEHARVHARESQEREVKVYTHTCASRD